MPEELHGGTAGRRTPGLFLRVPDRFSLRETALSHGWHQMLPFRWDGGSPVLWRAETLPGAAPCLFGIHQGGGAGSRLCIRFFGHPPEIPERKLVRARVARMLNLHLDLSCFYRMCRKTERLRYVPRKGAGRFLSAGNLYEDVFKALCATNISWKQAVSGVNRVTTLGPSAVESDFRAFPGPERILSVGRERLSRVSRLGYRVPNLVAWAERAVSNDSEYREAEDGTLDREAFKRFLLAIRGIGPSSCRYLMMLRGLADEIPLDSSAFLYLRENRFRGRTPSPGEIGRLYVKFGDWKACAYWFEFLPWAREHWGLAESGPTLGRGPQ